MFGGSKVYRLEQSQLIATDRKSVFGFFSDAFNLEKLTPGFLNFEILTKGPIDMQKNSVIEYRIKLFGLPMYWRTRIDRFEPDTVFIDSQIKGPYALWRHTHTFEEVPEGTLMRDIVIYKLPFGFLGTLAHFLFVRRTLKKIFDFRRDALDGSLGGAS